MRSLSSLQLSSRLPSWLPPVALLFMVAAVYWQALGAGFVWDDKVFILESEQIRQWAGLWDIWRNPAASNELHYWPLLSTSFWLDHKLWGFNPAGFHLTNLLLHGINCLLLWRILLLLGLPGAWFIAALFAVHPVHVEPVMWITARKDLLATVFYLLAFMAWLRFRGLQEGHLQQRTLRRRGRSQRGKARQIQTAYLQLLLCYIAALLSKTVAITLPAVLLTWAWWQQGQITRRDVLHTAPLFLIALFIGLYSVDYYSGRAHIGFEYALLERIIIAAQSLWFYVAKLLWPQPLLVIYPHWDSDPARLLNWLAPLATAALLVGLYAARQRLGRGPLAGVLFFAITLSPMLGFADNSYMRFSFVADRYQYLASVGLMMVLVAAMVTAASGGYQRLGASGSLLTGLRNLLRGLAVLLLLICGFLSTRHAALFQDEVALFRHVVATNPDAPRAYPSLGGALMAEYPAEAVEVFRAALQREPDDTHTYTRLSGTLIDLQRYEEAEALLNQAMALGLEEYPGVNTPLRRSHLGAKIPYNLGVVMLQQERLQEAEAAFRRVLELEADNQDAMGQLAVLHFNAERFAEALPLFRRIAEMQPDRAQSHLNLGATLDRVGQLQEALQSLERAVALQPQNESVREYRDALLQQLSNAP